MLKKYVKNKIQYYTDKAGQYLIVNKKYPPKQLINKRKMWEYIYNKIEIIYFYLECLSFSNLKDLYIINKKIKMLDKEYENETNKYAIIVLNTYGEEDFNQFCKQTFYEKNMLKLIKNAYSTLNVVDYHRYMIIVKMEKSLLEIKSANNRSL